MTEKASILSKWIKGQTVESVNHLIDSAIKGDFNLRDHKVSHREGAEAELFYEFLFLYLHLVDVHVYQHAPLDRDNLQNFVINDLLGDLSMDRGQFSSIYNERMQFYSRYNKLFAEVDKGEDIRSGTLFWEFSKNIANVFGESSNVVIILAVHSILMRALTGLWSLHLFNTEVS